MAIENGSVIALTLLDLSAALDTFDHDIPLNRLERLFGISGFTQTWPSFCLTGRVQQMKLEDTLSPSIPIPFGVPQGSVLCPLLLVLILSVLPFKDIISLANYTPIPVLIIVLFVNAFCNADSIIDFAQTALEHLSLGLL